MGLFGKINWSTAKPTNPVKPKKDIDTNPACPHCGVLLQTSPKRKSKCPDCGKDIFYRGTQTIFPSALLTEEQADVADEYKHFLYTAEEFGFSDDSYQKAEEALSKKFGRQPNPGDVIWSLYNQLILRAKDYGVLKGIYYSMALFLNKRGKDHVHILELSLRMDLLNWKSDGVNRFTVYSEHGCDNCKKNHGKKVSLDEALTMNILPCRSCTEVLFEGKKPFCRCYYNPDV